MLAIQQDPTQDLNPETLGALSALMLAQGQEIFVQKAIHGMRMICSCLFDINIRFLFYIQQLDIMTIQLDESLHMPFASRGAFATQILTNLFCAILVM